MVSAYIIQVNSVFPFIKRPTINKAVTIVTDKVKPLFYKILNEISLFKKKKKHRTCTRFEIHKKKQLLNKKLL